MFKYETEVVEHYFIVRQTSCREDRDLLTSGYTVHDINGGDTSLNHLLWINTTPRVDRLTCSNIYKIWLVISEQKLLSFQLH